MLKIRVIPILTFNGFSLVKTKQFNLPRTIGNPIQAARVYNSRNVDELVFIDIEATSQKRKINHVLVKKIIDENNISKIEEELEVSISNLDAILKNMEEDKTITNSLQALEDEIAGLEKTIGEKEESAKQEGAKEENSNDNQQQQGGKKRRRTRRKRSLKKSRKSRKHRTRKH